MYKIHTYAVNQTSVSLKYKDPYSNFLYFFSDKQFKIYKLLLRFFIENYSLTDEEV